MSYEFTKLSAVNTVESISENGYLIAEDEGAIVRVPVMNSGPDMKIYGTASRTYEVTKGTYYDVQSIIESENFPMIVLVTENNGIYSACHVKIEDGSVYATFEDNYNWRTVIIGQDNAASELEPG